MPFWTQSRKILYPVHYVVYRLNTLCSNCAKLMIPVSAVVEYINIFVAGLSKTKTIIFLMKGDRGCEEQSSLKRSALGC